MVYMRRRIFFFEASLPLASQNSLDRLLSRMKCGTKAGRQENRWRRLGRGRCASGVTAGLLCAGLDGSL